MGVQKKCLFLQKKYIFFVFFIIIYLPIIQYCQGKLMFRSLPAKMLDFLSTFFFNPGREKRRPSLQSAFLSSIRFSLLDSLFSPRVKKKGRQIFFVKMEILFLGPQILTLFLAFLGFWVEKMTKNTKCTYPHQNRYFRS